jgi:hypothetical protein
VNVIRLAYNAEMVELGMRLDGLAFKAGTLSSQRTCTGIHIGVTNRDPSRSAHA